MRAAASSTSTTRTAAGTSGCRSCAARAIPTARTWPAAGRCCSRTTRRSRTTTAASCSSAPTATSTSALGDGGSEGDPLGNGQNLGTWLGKILRIDPNAAGGRAYSIPSGNPFTSQRGDRPEIYAYGLRNPWRFSFDRVTGDLAIGDVGQDKFEEIDFEGKGKAAGLNFGWKGYEGFRRYSSVPVRGAYAPPVLVRSHSSGFCAIVGGYVVRDRSLPGLYGRYLYGDNCNKGIYSVKLRPGHATGARTLPVHVNGLSSFGEDARGRIYLASLSGAVYRLAA